MEQRINAYEKGQGALKAMYGLGIFLAKSSIEKPLLNLIYGQTNRPKTKALMALMCFQASRLNC